QIIWSRPLIIGQQPSEVHITLALQESQKIAFAINNQAHEVEEEELSHGCQGIAELYVEEELPQSLDLNTIQTRCQRAYLSATECYQCYRELGINYGPAMQGIEWLAIGEKEVLARLRLPVEIGPCAISGTNPEVAQTCGDGDRGDGVCPCPRPYMLHP